MTVHRPVYTFDNPDPIDWEENFPGHCRVGHLIHDHCDHHCTGSPEHPVTHEDVPRETLETVRSCQELSGGG